ncbi:unnamed protein product [Heligmosomoides polygyrus]|uniref:Uncharacterized protein n=1 Tax=Heligmosomoides polygyrus TaxID=6339 RepID=A0A183FA57_HELPZ|nr:unnamed protein product [Heligmosomoides polygyrus]
MTAGQEGVLARVLLLRPQVSCARPSVFGTSSGVARAHLCSCWGRSTKLSETVRFQSLRTSRSAEALDGPRRKRPAARAVSVSLQYVWRRASFLPSASQWQGSRDAQERPRSVRTAVEVTEQADDPTTAPSPAVAAGAKLRLEGFLWGNSPLSHSAHAVYQSDRRVRRAAKSNSANQPSLSSVADR